jgi:ParB family chromosome partitioning protein
LETVASHYAGEDENLQQTEEAIVLEALDTTAEENLPSFALRLVLTDHVGIPREHDPDLLVEAEAAFAPAEPKAAKLKPNRKAKDTPALVKAPAKKSASKKQQAA